MRDKLSCRSFYLGFMLDHSKRIFAMLYFTVKQNTLEFPKLSSTKSTAEARRLNKTFELSSAEKLSSTCFVVLHDSGEAAIQTSCLCRAKQNS